MDALLLGIVARPERQRRSSTRLNTEVTKMLAQPEMRKRLGALIQADLERWKKLVADARFQLE